MAPSSLFELPPNRRILLVDDTKAIHDDYRKILAAESEPPPTFGRARAALFGDSAGPTKPLDIRFELDSAYQGRQALEMVRYAVSEGRPYAMAFVDIRMPPGWNGIETVQKLWLDDPELEIAICTSYSDFSWEDMVKEFGPSDQFLILKKPFDCLEVQQLACALTSKWRVERQARLRMDDLERMVEKRTEELGKAHAELLQSQKMEAVGRLAGGIAHDFNNLLTSILGFGEIALESVESGGHVAECIEEMRHAGNRAAALTSQLLSFSRRQMLEITDVDLNSLIIGMQELLRSSIHADVRIVTDLAFDLRLAKIDGARMAQAILNLAINARDAMTAGGELLIRTANVELDESSAQTLGTLAPGSYVLLTIRDTGCGMDQATKSQIFEPFFTTKPGGRGMGLPTVYGIVKQSDGHISVESTVDRGTNIQIYLPASALPAQEATAPPDTLFDSGGSETILLAEDEQAVRSLACHVLRNKGYTVLDAADGAEALELSNNYSLPIDLLLADVIMPGLSGPKLAQELDASRPGIKVLLISGYTAHEMSERGIAARAAVLPKPFSKKDLSRRVRRILDGAALEAALAGSMTN